MQASNNVILYSLARYVFGRFMAGAIVSTSMLSLRLQTVGAIKSAIWLSFAETIDSLWYLLVFTR